MVCGGEITERGGAGQGKGQRFLGPLDLTKGILGKELPYSSR